MLGLENALIRQGSFRLSAAFELPRDAQVAVVGPSGAGKSTLLHGIAGFADEVAGAIRWSGERIDSRPPWERPVSILFQEGNLFPHLTLLQNLALGLRPAWRPTAEERARVEAMLERVGLGGLGARRPGELSGGQQSRAALARVLLSDRPLVLLDEPFAALGPALRTEMAALARDLLAEGGRTVLMVTHDLETARGMPGGLIVVAEGRAAGPLPFSPDLPDRIPALAQWLGPRP